MKDFSLWSIVVSGSKSWLYIHAWFQCIQRACPRLYSVYTRLAHASGNGIKLGNLNGQKTLRASLRVALTLSQSVSNILSERGGEVASGEMGDKSKNARMQIKPDLWRGNQRNGDGYPQSRKSQLCRVAHATRWPETKYFTSLEEVHWFTVLRLQPLWNTLCLLSPQRYEYRWKCSHGKTLWFKIYTKIYASIWRK